MSTTAEDLSAFLSRQTGSGAAPAAPATPAAAAPNMGSPAAAARALIPQWQDAIKQYRAAATDPAGQAKIAEATQGVEQALDDVQRTAALKPDLQAEPGVPDLKIRQIGAKRAFAAIILGAIAGRAAHGSGWETAAKTLSSTMQNWRNGQIDKVQSGLNQYKTQIEAVKRHNEQARADLDDIRELAKTNLTLAQSRLDLHRAQHMDGVQAADLANKSAAEQVKILTDVNKLENDEADRHLAYQKYLDDHAKAGPERQRVQAEAELTAEKLRRVKAGLPETPKAPGGSSMMAGRQKLVIAASQNALHLLDQLEAEHGGAPRASNYFGAHPDGVLGSMAYEAGRSLLSAKQRKIDADMAGMIDEAIPVMTGGLRGSDSYRKFLIQQMPNQGDDESSAKEKLRVFRQNINGTLTTFRDLFNSDPQKYAADPQAATAAMAENEEEGAQPGTGKTIKAHRYLPDGRVEVQYDDGTTGFQ